ncbi:Uncharacterized protein cmbei_8005420 [Cryptosporidium meleagridis]
MRDEDVIDGNDWTKRTPGGDKESSSGGRSGAPDLSSPPGSGARPKTSQGNHGQPQSPNLRSTGGRESPQPSGSRHGVGPMGPFGHVGDYDADLQTLQRSIETLRENARRRKGESSATGSESGTSSGFGTPEQGDLFLQTAPVEDHVSLEDLIVRCGFQKDKLLQYLTKFLK